jgi:hypothetical protein
MYKLRWEAKKSSWRIQGLLFSNLCDSSPHHTATDQTEEKMKGHTTEWDISCSFTWNYSSGNVLPPGTIAAGYPDMWRSSSHQVVMTFVWTMACSVEVGENNMIKTEPHEWLEQPFTPQPSHSQLLTPPPLLTSPSHTGNTCLQLRLYPNLQLKVHKREKFLVSDFEFFAIL